MTFALCAAGFLGLTYLMHRVHLADLQVERILRRTEHDADTALIAKAHAALAAAEDAHRDQAIQLVVAAAEIERLTGGARAKVVALPKRGPR